MSREPDLLPGWGGAKSERARHTRGIAERYHLPDMTVFVGDLSAGSDAAKFISIEDGCLHVVGPLDPAPMHPSRTPDQRGAADGIPGSPGP